MDIKADHAKAVRNHLEAERQLDVELSAVKSTEMATAIAVRENVTLGEVILCVWNEDVCMIAPIGRKDLKTMKAKYERITSAIKRMKQGDPAEMARSRQRSRNRVTLELSGSSERSAP
jgi:hypothetical protein